MEDLHETGMYITMLTMVNSTGQELGLNNIWTISLTEVDRHYQTRPLL